MTKLAFVTRALVLLTLWVGLIATAQAQSVADNIRPRGSVCMAGQPCVGQPAGGTSASMSAMETTSAAAVVEAATEMVEEAVEEAVVETVEAAEETVAEVVEDGPMTTAAVSADFDAEATYNQNCMACHMTGAAGAPKLGDAAAWGPRIEKGMDALMNSVYNGIGAMPARGLCLTCSDEELRAIVNYMIEQ